MNTSDLLERLLRSSQGSAAQQGEAGTAEQSGLGGLLGGLLGAGGLGAGGGGLGGLLGGLLGGVRRQPASQVLLRRRVPAGPNTRCWLRWA